MQEPGKDAGDGEGDGSNASGDEESNSTTNK
jgi:hypothetical protein